MKGTHAHAEKALFLGFQKGCLILPLLEAIKLEVTPVPMHSCNSTRNAPINQSHMLYSRRICCEKTGPLADMGEQWAWAQLRVRCLPSSPVTPAVLLVDVCAMTHTRAKKKEQHSSLVIVSRRPAHAKVSTSLQALHTALLNNLLRRVLRTLRTRLITPGTTATLPRTGRAIRITPRARRRIRRARWTERRARRRVPVLHGPRARRRDLRARARGAVLRAAWTISRTRRRVGRRCGAVGCVASATCAWTSGWRVRAEGWRGWGVGG